MSQKSKRFLYDKKSKIKKKVTMNVDNNIKIKSSIIPNLKNRNRKNKEIDTITKKVTNLSNKLKKKRRSSYNPIK